MTVPPEAPGATQDEVRYATKNATLTATHKICVGNLHIQNNIQYLFMIIYAVRNISSPPNPSNDVIIGCKSVF